MVKKELNNKKSTKKTVKKQKDEEILVEKNNISITYFHGTHILFLQSTV